MERLFIVYGKLYSDSNRLYSATHRLYSATHRVYSSTDYLCPSTDSCRMSYPECSYKCSGRVSILPIKHNLYEFISKTFKKNFAILVFAFNSYWCDYSDNNTNTKTARDKTTRPSSNVLSGYSIQMYMESCVRSNPISRYYYRFNLRSYNTGPINNYNTGNFSSTTR